MVIYPEVLVTPDTPTVKFCQPFDKVDLSKELPRILNVQGWGCGTYFNVQFLNHEKTKLLASGRFVVTEEAEAVQTNDANPYQPLTKTVCTRSAQQLGEWWLAKVPVETEKLTALEGETVKVLADGTEKLTTDVVEEPPQKRKAAR